MEISYKEYIEDYADACASEIMKYTEEKLNNMLDERFWLKKKVVIPDYYETQAFKDSFRFFRDEDGCKNEIIELIENELDECDAVKKYKFNEDDDEVTFEFNEKEDDDEDDDFFDDDEKDEFCEQLKEKLERISWNVDVPCDAFCEEEYCGQLKESLEIILADEEVFNMVAEWDCWQQISEDADELKALMNELIEELKERV